MNTSNGRVEMMSICYGDNNQSYLLTQVLSSGGEGKICKIKDSDNCVAKIFRERDQQRDAKVRILKQFQWSYDIRKYVVLPQVILYEDEEKTRQCGYVMDKVDCSTSLTDTFTGNHPLSIKMRAVVGLNVCKALEAIHMNGVNSEVQLVIGDFNFNSIVVDRNTGDIHIIEADSFHLTVKHGDEYKVLPCTVLYPDLTMPEILKLFIKNPKADLKDLINNGYFTFSVYTDYYCMAYHLHLLLLNCTPFAYSIRNLEYGNRELAMNGNYSYSNLFNPSILPAYCPDFDILTPELKELFIRAFEKGANQPEVRPSPSEFIKALSIYIDDLTLCNCSKQGHYIRKGYQFEDCEWCRIEKIMEKEKQATHHDDESDDPDFSWDFE